MDEDEPRLRKTAEFPAKLEVMSVEQLKDYAEALREEMAKVEAEIAKRSDARSAAEAFFKKPSA